MDRLTLKLKLSTSFQHIASPTGGVQQQHAVAQLEQNNQRQQADLTQQPPDSEEQAQFQEKKCEGC
ncbi:TPA: hypothetical protein ACH3X2_000958 [Trebouxia sp. C0005]